MVIGFLNFSYAQKNDELNGIIKNLLVEQKLSGATWSIVSDNGEIITDAAGLKNIKTKELLNSNDKVHVGSVCKTILAAGILRMATLELLNLDDPVGKYLPNLPIKNQWHKKHPITIRNLLDHTSGLTDAKLWHIFSTTSLPKTPLEEVYLRSPNVLEVQTKPGSIHSYSNLGYTILAMIIEKITKINYEDYLDENLLKPLQMESSSFQFIFQKSDSKLAHGHFDNGEPIEALPMYLRPAGQFTTTAADVGKFLLFMMSDGNIDGNIFINAEYLKAVGKQEFTEAYINGLPFGVGLGAYSRDRYGVVGIAKNGNTLGFSSMIYMFPLDKKAFFISYNMDSETANYDLFNEVLVKFLGLATKIPITVAKVVEKEIENWNGYFVPVITKVEPFGLLDLVFSHTKVEVTKMGARLVPFQGKEKSLLHVGKNRFSMKDRTEISHVFYKNENDEILITDGINTLKKVSSIKLLAIVLSFILGLSSMILILLLGLINIFRYKFDIISKPQFWLFAALVILVISIGLIVIQPFMSMGNPSFANVFLTISTLLIPLFAVVSVVLIVKNKESYAKTFSFWTTLFVIQFCLLLMANNLIPIVMWK